MTMSAPAPTATKIGLNTSLPSIRRIHALIRDKNEVEIKLVTGDQLRGRIIWIDDQCLCMDSSGPKIVIWQHAIAFIKG
jgi:host factor-I protein